MQNWINLVTEWIGETEKVILLLKSLIAMCAIFTMVIAWILSAHIDKLTKRIEKLEEQNDKIHP